MLAVIMTLGATISAVIASSKNRNVVAWFFAGACFPAIAIIILACQPTLAPPLPAEPQLPPSRAV